MRTLALNTSDAASQPKFGVQGIRGVSRIALAFFAALLLVTLPACEEEPAVPITPPTPPEPEYRIVTLAPAMTQIVKDLGLGEAIVGVSQNDLVIAPDADVEIVGTYQKIDYEKLLELDPTHVIMMTGKEGTPAQLTELATAGEFVLASYPQPTTVYDIYNILIAGSPEAMVIGGPKMFKGGRGDTCLGLILDKYDAAQQVAQRIPRQLTAISNATIAGTRSQKVLMLIGTNPYMASGQQTIYDEMLFRQTHSLNAAFSLKASAPTLDLERIQSLKPDLIVFVMPGAAPLGKLTEDPRTKPLMELDIPAVQHRPARIRMVNHPLVALPSSSLPIAAAELAKAVHPDLAESIDTALEISAERAKVEDEDGQTPDEVDRAPLPGSPSS